MKLSTDLYMSIQADSKTTSHKNRSQLDTKQRELLNLE